MHWYYIVLIVVGILFVILLTFFVCKTLGGHMVSWEGGLGGFLQAVVFVAHWYLLKWHIIRLKPIKILDSPNHKKNNQKEKKAPDPQLLKLTLPGNKEEEVVWEKVNLFHARATLRVHKSIPFDFDLGDRHKRLAIYYEQNYDEDINNYIRNKYGLLVNLFKKYSQDITFVYFPILLENIKESIHYNNPSVDIGDVSCDSPETFYQIITENIVNIPTTRPMILITDYYNSAGYPKEMLGENEMSCFFYELEYISDWQLTMVLYRHAEKFEHDYGVFHSLSTPPPKDAADADSIDIIATEIQTRINKLYAMGVSEYVISKIVSLPKPKLSTLIITENFHIILPDYNNMEIYMPILSKVLYFFYLNHPEGVLFKELRGHKKELYKIYRIISPLEDMEKMKKSIEDIVDSTKNSVNEKCSRIKAAFVSQFNDHIAKQYYITGNAGEAKKIELDRALIIDKSGQIIT